MATSLTTASSPRKTAISRTTDPLNFTDLKPYKGRVKASQKATGRRDAIINARGKLLGREVLVSAMEYGFIGGSMGAVVGETITRAVEKSWPRASRSSSSAPPAARA